MKAGEDYSVVTSAQAAPAANAREMSMLSSPAMSVALIADILPVQSNAQFTKQENGVKQVKSYGREQQLSSNA